MQVNFWRPLEPGDEIDIIAPAGRVSAERLTKLTELFTSWQLKVYIAEDMQGDDLLCANSDSARLRHLQNALINSRSKAIVCARGGYGTMRLLPALFKMPAPSHAKLLLGMSDITALQIFLQQQWGWATLHGSASVWHLTEASINLLKRMMLGEINKIKYAGLTPLNNLATQTKLINSSIVGGNLCLVQCSLGTAWQLNTRAKIILLEEINERAYKVDRMLEQLYQADIFSEAAAVIFGDFIGGAEPNGTSLIKPVLARFAERLTVPVLQMSGIGHGTINQPIPLGTSASLQLGSQSCLLCELGN